MSAHTTLEQQTQADACLFCPAFRWQRVRATVDDLPEVIELGGDSKFAVKYSTINPKQALGIQPKETADRAGVVFGLGSEGPRRDVEPTPVRSVPEVRYADVAGQDAALAQLKNVVELPLRHAAYFEALRVEPQRGILLYGPPGNGEGRLAVLRQAGMKSESGCSDPHRQQEQPCRNERRPCSYYNPD